MAIANLNKNFQCNNPLFASDLNDIVAALNSIINHVNSNLSSWDNSRVDVPTISYDPSTGVLTIDGTPYQIENPNDLNLGVAVYEGCPGTIQNPQIGAIYKCTSTGHIYIYTGKNSDSVTINGTTRTGWFDLGEFSGSGSSYLHIAYALSITFSNTNPPVITGYEGFTTSVNTGTFYKWYGIYTDDNEEDPTISNNNSSALNLEIVRKYKWNYLKGPDTNNKEYIYMYSDDKTHSPNVASTTGYAKINGTWLSGLNSSNDEFLPYLSNTNAYFRRDYWYDDPIENVSSTWPVLWWSSRSRNSDGTWGAFRTPTILDEYTLVSPGLTPSGSQGGPRWAFGRFSDSTTASSAVDTINANITEGSTFAIPSGWSESDNLASGSGDLYMIYAYVNGNGEIIKNQRTVSGQTQDFYWYGPFRIGSNNSTSGIGADDDNYNYIYCRTTSDVVSTSNGNTQLTNDDWSRIIYNIELLENNFVSNNEHVYNSSDTINNYNNLWTDHPLGVSSIYPYEWKMAFTKVLGETVNIGGGTTTQKYKLEWGPFLDSHFGHDGRDGDGFEYIFRLALSPTIQTVDLSQGGKYRNPDYDSTNPSSLEYFSVSDNITVNSEAYLNDDFIPKDWDDDNSQNLSASWPIEYMSKRKKEGLGDNRKWGPFSNPVIWRTFASNGILANLDNDSIILDDNATQNSVEYASYTKPTLWNGATNLTLTSGYSVTIDFIGDTELKNILRPGIATESGSDVLVSSPQSWGTTFSNCNAEQRFALTTTTSSVSFVGLIGKTGLVIYTISNSSSLHATIVQSISVVDYGEDGESYKLMISPNSIHVQRTDSSSPYTISGGSSSVSLGVSVTKSEGTGFNTPTILGTLPTSTPVDKGLYIRVKNSNSIAAQQYLSSSGSGGEIYYTYNNSLITLYNITPLSSNGNYDYLEVELYIMYNGNAIKVDNEIINFVPKGDDGTISGDLSSIETYNIVTENDNAYIDDQTVNANVLKTATTYVLNVLKGTSDITSACSFEVVDINLPSGLGLYPITNISNGTVGSLLSTNSVSNYNAFCIQPTGSPSITTIPISDQYYYTLKLRHSGITTQNITKKFKLVVLDISQDGSIYMLHIAKDVLKYDSSETLVTTDSSKPVISVLRITLSGLYSNVNFAVYNDYNNISTVEDTKLYIILGDLMSYATRLYSSAYPSINSGTNGIDKVFIRGNVPYTSSPYTVKLYLGSMLIGEEDIDCIKDGGGAVSGYSSIIKRLYTLHNSTTNNPLPNKPRNNSYCNLSNGKLYSINNNGTLSGEITGNSVLTNGSTGYYSDIADVINLKNGSSYYDGYKFYVIAATASGAADTIDEIVSNTTESEWSDPVECDETGSDKLNVKTIFLYYRGDSAPNKPEDTCYYRFSTEKLLSSRSGTTEPTNGYSDGNSKYWLRNISNPDTTKNLYVTFATASNFSDLDEITTSEWSTPEMYSAGKVTSLSIASAGKMYYYVGEYGKDNISLSNCIATKYQVPYIKYNEHFYVLYVLDSELDTNGSRTATGWPTQVGNTYADSHWKLMIDENKFYIADAYFGDFAKFGSAIISGDYIISTNGKIGSTLYNNGATLPTTTISAYTKFICAPTNNVVFTGICSNTSSYNVPLNIPLGVGIDATLERLSSSGILNCILVNSSNTNNTTPLVSVTSSSNNSGTISSSSYSSGYIKIGTTSTTNVNFKLTLTFTNSFEPNWWVNLLTGEQGAAQNKFLIDSSGDVNVEGNITATGGTIGGFDIYNDHLQTSDYHAGELSERTGSNLSSGNIQIYGLYQYHDNITDTDKTGKKIVCFIPNTGTNTSLGSASIINTPLNIELYLNGATSGTPDYSADALRVYGRSNLLLLTTDSLHISTNIISSSNSTLKYGFNLITANGGNYYLPSDGSVSGYSGIVFVKALQGGTINPDSEYEILKSNENSRVSSLSLDLKSHIFIRVTSGSTYKLWILFICG